MMKWYSVESTVAKSVDVEMIRHGFSPPGEKTNTDSIDNINTEFITRNNGRGVIIEEWEKLEAIASNALLIILLYIIFYFMYFICYFFHLISCNFIIIIN